MDIFRYFIICLFFFAGCAHTPPGQLYPKELFLLYSQTSPEDASDLSLEAQAFLKSLEKTLQLKAPPGTLLKIYHYRRRWNLWQYLRQAAPAYAWRPAVCVETAEAYHVAISGDSNKAGFKKNLRHELTHYLLAVHYSYLPPWIDEGLAQIMSENPALSELNERSLSSIKKQIKTGDRDHCAKSILFPPRHLMSATEYHIAYALTYYLLMQKADSIHHLHQYLKNIHAKSNPQQIFQDHWGTSIDEACDALAPYYQAFE